MFKLNIIFKNVLDCYGIRTEGELFSGHFASLRNRLSDRDSDDMRFVKDFYTQFIII